MKQKHDMDRIVQALESSPRVEVPSDFAARVMGRLPQQNGRPRFSTNALPSRRPFGRTLLIVALVLLLAGMALLAPASRHSAIWLTLQSVLFLEFCLLSLWAARSWCHV